MDNSQNQKQTFGQKILSLATQPFGRTPGNVNVEPAISDECISRIPATGGCIVVANHPYGGIEPGLLANVIQTVRGDFRIVDDRRLVPAGDERFITIDPLDASDAALRQRSECVDFVKGGGMLVVMPAREVSRIDFRRRTISDFPWRLSLASLIRAAEAPVLPVFIGGFNSPAFQILGMIHHRLATIIHPREMSNLEGKQIKVRIGTLIPVKKLELMSASKELVDYLRMRTYILNSFQKPKKVKVIAQKSLEPVVPAGDLDALVKEIDGLPAEQTLVRSGEFSVIYAMASQMPLGMAEIGRMREITFREVNEGTGKSTDIDAFDAYYVHLFVWNNEKKEIVGAYRLGQTDKIIEKHGQNGLYTTTLFKFKKGLLENISPALEMGRSFVRSEYQRSYAPLMLLWKGIGAYVCKNPQYKILFGPVSINDQYNSISRQLMIRFLRETNYMQDLAHLVKAKTPPKKNPMTDVDSVSFADIEDVSDVISQIETDGKGVPILLKQYLRLGGKLLGCNIDPEFSNVLDALVLVDLSETDFKILTRYMGKEPAEQFLAWHGKKAELKSVPKAQAPTPIND